MVYHKRSYGSWTYAGTKEYLISSVFSGSIVKTCGVGAFSANPTANGGSFCTQFNEPEGVSKIKFFTNKVATSLYCSPTAVSWLYITSSDGTHEPESKSQFAKMSPDTYTDSAVASFYSRNVAGAKLFKFEYSLLSTSSYDYCTCNPIWLQYSTVAL